jgi:hypothetical protein
MERAELEIIGALLVRAKAKPRVSQQVGTPTAATAH